MRRRTFLVTAVPAAISGLAGCGDGYGGGGSTPTETTDAPTETKSDARTQTPSPAPTSTPSPTPTATETSTPTSTRTRTPSPTATSTSSPAPTDTPTPTPTSDADQVVRVAPGGSLSFSPESFTIAVGDTVEWRWEAGSHNVRPDSIPDGSSWPGDDDDTYGEGHTHSHEFTVAGSYSYYCVPHRNIGMTGSFTVE